MKSVIFRKHTQENKRGPKYKKGQNRTRRQAACATKGACAALLSLLLVLNASPLGTKGILSAKAYAGESDNTAQTIDADTLAQVQNLTQKADGNISYTSVSDVELPEIIQAEDKLSAKLDSAGNKDEGFSLLSLFGFLGNSAGEVKDIGSSIRVKATFVDASKYQGETIDAIMGDYTRIAEYYLTQSEFSAELYDYGDQTYYAAFVDMPYELGTTDAHASDWAIAADNYEGEDIDGAYYDNTTGVAYLPKIWVEARSCEDTSTYTAQVQLLYPYTQKGEATTSNSASSNVIIKNVNTGEAATTGVTQSIYDQITNIQLASPAQASSIDAESISVTLDGTKTYTCTDAEHAVSSETAIYDSMTGILTLPTNTVGVSLIAVDYSSDENISTVQTAETSIGTGNDIGLAPASLKNIVASDMGQYLDKWFTVKLWKDTEGSNLNGKWGALDPVDGYGYQQNYTQMPDSSSPVEQVDSSSNYSFSPFVGWKYDSNHTPLPDDNGAYGLQYRIDMANNPTDWSNDGLHNGWRGAWHQEYNNGQGGYEWTQLGLPEGVREDMVSGYSSELQQMDWSYTETLNPVLYKASCIHISASTKRDSNNWHEGIAKVIGINYTDSTITLAIVGSMGNDGNQTCASVFRFKCEGKPTGTVELVKTSANSDITKGNPNYSYEGAEYYLYTSMEEATAATADNPGNGARMYNINKAGGTKEFNEGQFGEGGYCWVNDLEQQNYYIRELKASPGYRVCSEIHAVSAESFTCTTDEGKPMAVITCKEEPIASTARLGIKKVDKSAEETTIDGAEFCVKFYATSKFNTSVSELAKATPTAQWTFTTKEGGQCRFNNHFKTAWKYHDIYAIDEQAAIPAGVITVQETSAPEGYELDSTIYRGVCTTDGTFTWDKPNDGSITLTLANQAITIPDEPDEPGEPDTPDEPDDPGDPDEPSDPSEPDDPDEPSEPDEPDEPDEPSEPDNPSEPSEPDEPDTPDEPSEPDDPDEPSDPSEPDEPDEPGVPEEPDEPNEPDGPSEPDEPDTPDDPDEPDEPSEPNEPDTPDEPDVMDEPEDPNMPDVVDEPSVPKETNTPNVSNKSSAAEKPASSVTASPTTAATKTLPQTGETKSMLAITAALASAALAGLLVARRKLRKSKSSIYAKYPQLKRGFRS